VIELAEEAKFPNASWTPKRDIFERLKRWNMTPMIIEKVTRRALKMMRLNRIALSMVLSFLIVILEM
jgi:hypothetical protein